MRKESHWWLSRQDYPQRRLPSLPFPSLQQQQQVGSQHSNTRKICSASRPSFYQPQPLHGKPLVIDGLGERTFYLAKTSPLSFKALSSWELVGSGGDKLFSYSQRPSNHGGRARVSNPLVADLRGRLYNLLNKNIAHLTLVDLPKLVLLFFPLFFLLQSVYTHQGYFRPTILFPPQKVSPCLKSRPCTTMAITTDIV